MSLLGVRVRKTRESIDPNEASARIWVVCEITATGEAVERVRPALDTMLALDVSGSMTGPPIEHVILSVERLVDLFQPNDRVGIVAFSSGATQVCELLPMDAAGKNTLRTRARRLAAEGNTAVEAGLTVSHKALATGMRKGARRGVLLLSDGAPNVGASTKEALSDIVQGMRGELSVSTLGYGQHHNEDVLSGIAQAGGGRYFFVQDPHRCQHEFAMAVGAQADVVADSVQVAFVPAPGVQILRVLGVSKNWFSAAGLVAPLGDLMDGQKRVVAAELSVEKGDAARLLRELMSLRVSGMRAGTEETVTEVVSVHAEVREGVPMIDADGVRAVLVLRGDETRGAARALADRGQWEGAAATLRALMKEMDEAKLFVKNDGSELADVYELLLDEAMAMERRPSAEQYQAFRKGAVRTMLNSGGTAGIKGKGTMDALMRTSGVVPDAFLVEVRGGKRHKLGPQCTLGRTHDADIVIQSDRVSRRHADVYALHGDFWICDLGSTNTTSVNGMALGAAPHHLRNGDVVELGGVQLRFEG
jgi:Ca-activated chloride channel family protein